MSFLDDALKFEAFNVEGIVDGIKKAPERLAIGAIDPASSKAWSAVTGKDYQPLVDQYGGATEDTYQRAEQDGIDTGPGRTMHGVARTVVNFVAGGKLADKAGIGGEGGEGGDSVSWDDLPDTMPSGGSSGGSGSAGGQSPAHARAAELRRQIAEVRARIDARRSAAAVAAHD